VIELIHAQRSKQTTGVRAWQANTALLLPALKSIQMQPDAASGAVRPWVAWVGPGLAPPGHDGVRTQPFTPTWAAQGVDIRRFVWVSAPEQARGAMDNAWAAEQLLRCQDVGAVVVYGLPESTQTSQILRRLQYTASRHHKYVWVIRPAEAAAHASPAVLRLQWCAHEASGVDTWLRMLKCSGAMSHQLIAVSHANIAVQQAVQAAKTVRRWRREQDALQPLHTAHTPHAAHPSHPSLPLPKSVHALASNEPAALAT